MIFINDTYTSQWELFFYLCHRLMHKRVNKLDANRLKYYCFFSLKFCFATK